MKKFTLIELLVVVAVIALLLTILLPSLVMAKERAKQAVCQSNQSQLVKAMALYSTSYDNVLPVGGASNIRISMMIWQKRAYLSQAARNTGKGWLPFGLLYENNESLANYESWSCPSRTDRTGLWCQAKEDRFPIENPWDAVEMQTVSSDYLLRSDDTLKWDTNYTPKYTKIYAFENDFTLTSDAFSTYDHWNKAHGQYGVNIFSTIDGSATISKDKNIKNQIITLPNRLGSVSNNNIIQVWQKIDEIFN